MRAAGTVDVSIVLGSVKEYHTLKKAKEAEKMKDKEEKSGRDKDCKEGNEDASLGGTPVASIVVEKSKDAIEVSIAHFHIDPGHYSKSPWSCPTIYLMQY